MEANELMIGDFVLDGNIYAQVTSITCNGNIETTHNEHSNIELIEPILLTPEILEKNGLECKHKGESPKRLYWILNVEGGSVKVKVNRGLFLFDIHGVPFQHGFYLPYVNKHIQYVHDLQHAFRLCGITREIIL